MGAVRNTGCLYLIDNTELSPQIRLYVFIRADTIWYHLAPSGRTLSGESTRTPRVCGAKTIERIPQFGERSPSISPSEDQSGTNIVGRNALLRTRSHRQRKHQQSYAG